MIEVIDLLNPAFGHQRVERRLLGGTFPVKPTVASSQVVDQLDLVPNVMAG